MNVINETVEQTPLDQLKVHPDNPRRGNIDAIKDSIQENGFFGTIIAQRSTGFILAGNHRFQAAQALGLETVPVAWVDVDDRRAAKILLADNRASDLSLYDDDTLADLLTALQDEDDLAGTGFDADDVEELLISIGQKDLEVPPAPKGAAPEELPLAMGTAEQYRMMLTYHKDDYAHVVKLLEKIMRLETANGRELVSYSETIKLVLEERVAAAEPKEQ